MNTPPTLLALGASLLMSSASHAELVTFENTNPAMDTLAYYQIGNGYTVLGQTLDVTTNAYEQSDPGQTPVGSLLISWFEATDSTLGDWIYMGPGRNTQIGAADKYIEVIDPYTHHPVGHPGPGDFDDGSEIGEGTEWSPSWVVMHAVNDESPAEGVYFTDESFTIALRFLMDDNEFHYGFAELTRTAFIPGDPLSIRFRPVRWGYETTAGMPVPGPGSSAVLMLLGLDGTRRRR